MTALGLRARKVRALFAHAFATMAEYRAEIVIRMISGSLPLVLVPVVAGMAWAAALAAAGAALVELAASQAFRRFA